MPSSLPEVFFATCFLTSIYCNCYVIGCRTLLDGKGRQKSIYSKETQISYINCVTEDAYEK